MLIRLVGQGESLDRLHTLVRESLAELEIADSVRVETTDDEAYKAELGITKFPALCIEEEAIAFRDTIFEGFVPDKSELSSMFLAIVGGGEMEDAAGCGSGCGTCATGCGSHAGTKSEGCGCGGAGTDACTCGAREHAHSH